MNELQRQIVRSLNTFIQQGEDAPNYIIRLKRPHKFYLAPVTLEIEGAGAVSIETGSSEQFGANTATVTIENAHGLRSPEWGSLKPTKDIITTDLKKTHWEKLLLPETHIQIFLGYGRHLIPVLTGAIDECDIDEDSQQITLSIRDNMRYLVDQNIDGMKFGLSLQYPRTDVIYGVQNEQVPIITTVMVKGIKSNSFLNIRTGPGTNFKSIGRANNGDTFKLVSEVKATNGETWYKVRIGEEDRFIHSLYAEVVITSQKIAEKRVVIPDRKFGSLSIPVYNGAGIGTGMKAVLIPASTPRYISTKVAPDGSKWYEVTYNGTYTGYVHSLFCGESETGVPLVSDVHPYMFARSSKSPTAPAVGMVYCGNAYEYIKSEEVSGVAWHLIKFVNEQNQSVTGYLSDEVSALVQRTSTISYPTVIKVHGVTTHAHIRSGPGTQYAIVKEVYQNEIYSYLGSVQGDDNGTAEDVPARVPPPKSSNWAQIVYKGSDGNSKIGYLNGIFIDLQSGDKPLFEGNPTTTATPPSTAGDIMVDLSGEAPQNEAWTAQAIVMDLSILATTIGFNGGAPELNRIVCNVVSEDFIIQENGGDSRYIVKQAEFKCNQSYYDSAMQIVNQLGDVLFKADRYGDITLKRNRKYTSEDLADFEIHDYIELNSSKFKYGVQDLRNRIIVNADNGTSMFEMRSITNKECCGVNRTMAFKVPWADTISKRKQAAASAFQQMLQSYRSMSIAIVGNPLIEVGSLIKMNNLNSTAHGIYRVTDVKQVFSSESGYMTMLEMRHLTLISASDLTLITEEFPKYVKKFEYTLTLANNKRQMKIKLPSTIYKASIKIYCCPDALVPPAPPNADGTTPPPVPIDNNKEELIAVVDVVGDTYMSGSSEGAVVLDTRYVTVQRKLVNVRKAPDTTNESIKRVCEVGDKFELLQEQGDFVKVKDSDGEEAYIWASYCEISTVHGNSNPSSIAASGVASYFVQLAKSQLGAGYIWGADGQMLTYAGLAKFKRQFGAGNYAACCSNWVGRRVFDCSGLVCWLLRQMNLFGQGEDYTAMALYSKCNPVSKSNVQPGDLFFRSNRSGGIYHVGICIGNGRCVHASSSCSGVIEGPLGSPELFGRLKKLTTSTSYTMVDPSIINIGGSGSDVSADLTGEVATVSGVYTPTKYTLTTTFDVKNAPADVLDLVKRVKGQLLLYLGNPVLYNVVVHSNGGDMNELVLYWGPRRVATSKTKIRFEILVY